MMLASSDISTDEPLSQEKKMKHHILGSFFLLLFNFIFHFLLGVFSLHLLFSSFFP